MIRAPSRHWGFVAAILHRLSGVALAVFLPLHILALGTALSGEAALDSFLAWADNPLLKASEVLLVVALALHMALGLRVLALEFLPWRGARKRMAAGAVVLAAALGLGYLAALV
jgi:fumarate reductase subunit D